MSTGEFRVRVWGDRVIIEMISAAPGERRETSICEMSQRFCTETLANGNLFADAKKNAARVVELDLAGSLAGVTHKWGAS